MVTQEKIYTLRHHQLNELDKLIFWCKDKYIQSTTSREKRMWGGRHKFFIRLLNQNTYTEYEKKDLNEFREMYLKDGYE